MKTFKTDILSVYLLAIAPSLLLHAAYAGAADFAEPVPPIIAKGFELYATAGPVPALNTWRQGGLLENQQTSSAETEKIRQMVRPLRIYKSYEVTQTRKIGETSMIVYVSILFQRGVLYGHFLIYRTDRGWLVQNMEFNTRPEIIMPWLASGGGG